MRTRLRHLGVYSLSAVDLFASAMGAFIIITIVLMPDYQKEVRLEGHLAYVESMADDTRSVLEETASDIERVRESLHLERQREARLEVEQEIASSELESLRRLVETRAEQVAEPDEPEPDATEHLVTFRFLGLKTDKTRILIMVDMNKYLAEHEDLVTRTIGRALASLRTGYEFALLGFQQLDSGPVYHRWPEDGSLAPMSAANRRAALRFADGLAGKYGGSSSVRDAFGMAFQTPAEAFVLLSDGLPNPSFNGGLPPRALIQDIVEKNTRNREIHAVTVGDYFKYRGTVEFMENLARANAGGFLALAQ